MSAASDAYTASLESIVTAILADPGLKANVTATELADGIAAARSMNALLATIIDETGVNADGVISEADMVAISEATRANATYYDTFLAGHGDDEWNIETGFHLVQNDGGLLQFQGRKLIDTVLDAIYHFGFMVYDGRFVNEDGNANELAADVAGWLNYFLNGVNVVFGSDLDDDLHSGTYNSALAAAANEVFEAGAGDDDIWAGDGDDTVNAGDGDDRSGGGNGNDMMRGGAGMDQLWGDGGHDKIYGDGGDDSLGGGTGNDTLNGCAGNDEVYGQEGNDILRGGIGDDKLGGGYGNDKLFGDDGADTLWADAGDDELNGGDGDDTLGGGSGADTFDGGAGIDLLYGDDGNDKMNGGDGDDRLSGGNGADCLRGGNGNDELKGNNGVDILVGGAGADKIYLWDDDGAADKIIFSLGDSGRTRATIDRVEGFTSGEDLIDLRSFAAMTFEDLDYVGGGQASCYYDGRYLRIDADGDRASDLIIAFAWVNELTAADFLFA